MSGATTTGARRGGFPITRLDTVEAHSVEAVSELARIARAEISQIADPALYTLTETDLKEFECHGVGIGWYKSGRLLGCWLSWGSSLLVAIRRTAALAWQLTGIPQPSELEAEDLNVVITILRHPRFLGELTAPAVANAFDLGEETLVASSGNHSAAVFPHFVCHHGWSGHQTAELALRKAGIASTGSAKWSAYQTTTWVDGEGRQFPIKFGFPLRSDSAPAANIDFRLFANSVGDFIASLTDSDGLPFYLYDPLTDTTVKEGPIGRVIFALDALAEAASVLGNENWAVIAKNGLQFCVDRLTLIGERVRLDIAGRPGSAAAECELLASLASWLPEILDQPTVRILAQQIRTLFKPDGTITHLAAGFRSGVDHDILPGVALVALGRYAKHTESRLDMTGLEEQLAWYRRRFRTSQSWAMVGWQMQGWSVIADVALVSGAKDFVFELTDWALSLQLDLNGAFLTDLAALGPSFHTAWIAEGVAEAWRLAELSDEPVRAVRYANSWRRSMGFMHRLTMEEADGFMLPNPSRAAGGVRSCYTDSRLRIDYAAHLLRALARGIALMSRTV